MTDQVVVLGRKNLYMLPTRYGLVFSVVLLVLLMGAVNYNNGLAYLLTFLLAANALVSMLYTHANLAGLRVVPGPCPPVFAGDPARLAVCLRNDNGRARLGIALEQGQRVQHLDLPPGTRSCANVEIQTRRRGYIDGPPFVIATLYPLGLVRSWSRRLQLSHRCLVYPRPGPMRPLPREGDEGEGRSTEAVLAGDDFIGLRAFRTGDSPQHVHWKTFARGHGLQVKEFGVQEGEIVWLDWARLPELDTEARLSQLCRWVLEAERRELEYGLRLPNETLPPARGAAHRARCLEALALFDPNQ